jgi:endonuclease G, mitochondrial
MKGQKIMVTIIFVFTLSLTTLMSSSSTEPMEIHCKHFFLGYPMGTPSSNDLIIRDIYALSNNDTTKFADWVAYRISLYEVMRESDVTRVWRKDPWLADNETLDAKPDAYKGANAALRVDRGHQAPLASFGGTRVWHQTNYFSNITPQKSELNQGPWMRLESKIRDIVKTNKVVYIMTGPLYEKEMPPLPNVTVPHKVPSGYWKIVILPGIGNRFEVAAFIFPQETGRREKILSKLTTIRTIEQKSNLNFLWMLADDIEADVETNENRAFAEKYFKE